MTVVSQNTHVCQSQIGTKNQALSQSIRHRTATRSPQSIGEMAANLAMISILSRGIEHKCQMQLTSSGVDGMSAGRIAKRMSSLMNVVFLSADTEDAAVASPNFAKPACSETLESLKVATLKAVTPEVVKVISCVARNRLILREGRSISEAGALGRRRLIAFMSVIDCTARSNMTQDLHDASFGEITSALLAWAADSECPEPQAL